MQVFPESRVGIPKQDEARQVEARHGKSRRGETRQDKMRREDPTLAESPVCRKCSKKVRNDNRLLGMLLMSIFDVVLVRERNGHSYKAQTLFV